MRILILNGPNLNLLGTREPHIYGALSFEVYLEQLKATYPQIAFTYFQSNVEGELINKLHECGFEYDGIVFNAAAYTHTSIALADAISAIRTAVVEVHISNTHAREDFRQHSYISPVCKGVISGFGLQGYQLAIASFLTPR
ncbi:type II 3-dehydroquinate dehydratase [Flavobacterium sp. JP2137]|uniref:type II 3-dehydroquinate dehydratase n=1 Tax=Flavobacterium sp. JP2137 TaxID=3414510 RepID=UPI003D2FE75E